MLTIYAGLILDSFKSFARQRDSEFFLEVRAHYGVTGSEDRDDESAKMLQGCTCIPPSKSAVFSHQK